MHEYICVYTNIFKLLILYLLFLLALEGSLKASFGDLSILTFKQEGVHKAPYYYSLLQFFPCNIP